MAKVIGNIVKGGTKTATVATSATVKTSEKKSKRGRKAFVVPKGGFTSGIIEGFDFRKNCPLTRKDFADTASFLEYRGEALTHRAASFTELAAKMAAKVANIRKYGDEETRKKAEKLARLREQMAALEAELGEAGIDVDEVEDGEVEDETAADGEE